MAGTLGMAQVVAIMLVISNAYAQSTKPNILFIMADDLGWNDVGYHGHGEVDTPNLDALANDGVRLANYYVGPTCGPTRSQFLSGRYATRLGLHDSNLPSCTKQALDTTYTTIANELKDEGYSTHLIGKWHAGFYSDAHMPTSRGFDTFRGFLLSHGDHYDHTAGYSSVQYLDYRNNTDPYTGDDGTYSTTAFTDRAKELIASHDVNDPMFMYLSYQAPHTPLDVPSEFLTDYSTIPNADRKNYAGMVTALDDGVGQVVQSLKDAGMYNDTVIIFSSDNGGSRSAASNYPLKGQKGSYYEGGIRAVGFVSSPLIDAAYRDRDVGGLIHVTDWLPTMVSIAGSSVGSLDIDGINQWTAISTGGNSTRTEIVHNIQRRGAGGAAIPFNTNIQASMVTDDGWKIMTGTHRGADNHPNPSDDYAAWEASISASVTVPSGDQLYHIYSDPEELTNEYDNVLHVTVRDNLLADLRSHQLNRMIAHIDDTVYSECDPSLHGDVWGPWE